MAGPSAWQLAEEVKGNFLPFLRDVNRLKSSIELEISHRRLDEEYGSVVIRKINNPTPEDPGKIRKLGENVIQAILQTVDQYERLYQIEVNKHAIQETGQVTTTCPEVGLIIPECVAVNETQPASPFQGPPELMDCAEALFPDASEKTTCTSPVSPTSRPRLQRRDAVENSETIDLADK